MAKILAVEDEPLVRFLIVEALEIAGHVVLDAPDGEAALALVKDNPDVDVMVTDVRMPKMDGFQLALAARKLRPDLSLLFMTGYTDAAIPAELALSKVLLKPFNPDDLVASIEAMLTRTG